MRKILLLGLVVLTLACPSRANADSLAFAGTGKGVGGITIGGSLVNISNVFAGELDWTWLSAPPAGFDSSIVTYCVDILNDVTSTQDMTVLSTDLLTPATSTDVTPDAGMKAAWLFNTFAADVDSSGTDAQAAGLQIAIWKALYDTDASLTTGNVTFSGLSSDVALAATSYLQALYYAPGVYHTSTAVWLDALDPPRGAGQDQITGVPEPGTLFLMATGAIAFFRRRRFSMPA